MKHYGTLALNILLDFLGVVCLWRGFWLIYPPLGYLFAGLFYLYVGRAAYLSRRSEK